MTASGYDCRVNRLIRPSTIEDLPSIEEIYASARAFMRRSGNPNQWRDNKPDMAEVIRDIEEGHSYAIVEEAAIIAVFSALPSPDPTYVYIEGNWLNDRPYYVIHKIAKKASSKGILQEAVSFCLTKVDDVRIDTHADNKPMQQALAKLGFSYRGIIYLTNGEPRNAYHLAV